MNVKKMGDYFCWIPNHTVTSTMTKTKRHYLIVKVYNEDRFKRNNVYHLNKINWINDPITFSISDGFKKPSNDNMKNFLILLDEIYANEKIKNKERFSISVSK